MIKYYKNEEVIDLLVKLKKDKTMLDLGDTFEEVLSGKGWDEQKERYQSALIGAP